MGGTLVRALGRQATALAAVLLVSAGWILLGLGGPAVADLFSDLAQIGAPLYATVMCGLAARHVRRAGPTRPVLGWLLLGGGMLSWAAGQVVWTWLEHVRRVEAPFPSVADLGYLATVPLSVWGGALLLSRHRHAGRAVLDGLLVSGSLLSVSWLMVLGPLWHDQQDPLTWLVGIAYPGGDIVLATMMVVLLGQVSAAERWPSLLIGSGAILLAVGDSTFCVLIAGGDGVGPSPVHLAWIGGFLLIGLGARAATVPTPEPAPPAGAVPAHPGLRIPHRHLLPYLPVAVAFVTSLLVLRDTGSLDPLVYAVNGLLTAVIVVRQLLVAHENRRLSGRLTEAVENVRRLAYVDAVTGLPNRSQLINEMRMFSEPSASPATVSRPMDGGLLLVGLRSLREINDALGRDAGDELLRQVGSVLRRVVGPSALVARLGGDEFAVLVPSGDGLTTIGRHIVDTLREPATAHGVPVLLEPSVGVVHLTRTGLDPTLLLRRADAALAHGRLTSRAVQVWRHDLDMSSGDDLRVLTDLRTGISDGQLRLWYQLKVDAGTTEPQGVEALIRWQHPTRGLLTPDAFIPKAERSALITDLTRWVLADAIAQAREWIVGGRPMSVSVNVSAQSLADDSLPGTVAALLSTYQVPPELLTIEVTETAVMADPVRSAQRLAALRTLGVRVSIDDFGVGNTSLSLLTTLPIDELKLDRSFVSRITDSPAHATVVRMIAALGRELGMLIVAEGVEDEETAEALRHLNFDLLQGYLYARPVPAVDLPRPGRLSTVH